jgi:hypothetical protein
MRTPGIVFGCLFLAGLAVIAWQEYYPPSEMYEALGMTGPSAHSGRVCGHPWRWQTRFGRIPMREIQCRGPEFYEPGRMFREDVEMDGLTRRLTNATHTWSVPDSVEWGKELDSIPRSLTRSGAEPFYCPGESGWQSPTIVEARWWTMSNFYLRLVAYDFGRDERMTSQPGNPRWVIQMDGYPTLPDWCSGRYNPPRKDCRNGEGITIPLPGGWMICWRNPLLD